MPALSVFRYSCFVCGVLMYFTEKKRRWHWGACASSRSICVFMDMCICEFVYLCICIFMYLCICVSMYLYIYVFVYLRIYVFVYLCFVYLCIYVQGVSEKSVFCQNLHCVMCPKVISSQKVVKTKFLFGIPA